MKSENINILGISGSLRESSSNTSILKAAAKLTPINTIIKLYPSIADLPYFTPELNTENPPKSVIDFRANLASAHAIIICTPEYAYGMPGALKNALDWTVSSGEFVNKPVMALSGSPSAQGGEKAHTSVLLTLEALSAVIVKGASFTIPYILKKINEKGELSDDETKLQLEKSLVKLITEVRMSNN